MKSKAGFSKAQWKQIALALGSWAIDCSDSHEHFPDQFPTPEYAEGLEDRAWKVAHSLEDPQR